MTATSVRVVFDTNILISGHFWKGPPYRCRLAVDAGLAVLVLSEPILTELGEKLITKFGVSKADVDSIMERLRTSSELTDVEGKSGWVPQDPDDDKFIETALVGGATLIISGDRHLLKLGNVQGIEILTARQFLDRLVATSEV
ncbi:MAG: putative toxin-antitoxin system toxin component, PIN family [Acidimicrobiia bacterium]